MKSPNVRERESFGSILMAEGIYLERVKEEGEIMSEGQRIVSEKKKKKRFLINNMFSFIVNV